MRGRSQKTYKASYMICCEQVWGRPSSACTVWAAVNLNQLTYVVSYGRAKIPQLSLVACLCLINLVALS